MPGMRLGYEKCGHDKYQTVMILGLSCNRSAWGGVSPAFALICQYLSSTVRSLALTAASWMSEMVQMEASTV